MIGQMSIPALRQWREIFAHAAALAAQSSNAGGLSAAYGLCCIRDAFDAAIGAEEDMSTRLRELSDA